MHGKGRFGVFTESYDQEPYVDSLVLDEVLDSEVALAALVIVALVLLITHCILHYI